MRSNQELNLIKFVSENVEDPKFMYLMLFSISKLTLEGKTIFFVIVNIH